MFSCVCLGLGNYAWQQSVSYSKQRNAFGLLLSLKLNYGHFKCYNLCVCMCVCSDIAYQGVYLVYTYYVFYVCFCLFLFIRV